MKKIIIILITIIFLVSGCDKKQELKEEGIIDISCEQMKEDLKEDAILIDVRTKEEYQINHIEGAINIPVDEIESKIENEVKDKNKTIILYCQSGIRAGNAANILQEKGYKRIHNLGSITKCES